MSERDTDGKSQDQETSPGLEESQAREKARQDLAESSWILEVRRKLADPPPQVLVPRESLGEDGGNGASAAAAESATAGAAAAFAPRRAAALVPLFVDAGQLWTVITLRAQRVEGHASPPAFAGGLYGGPKEGAGEGGEGEGSGGAGDGIGDGDGGASGEPEPPAPVADALDPAAAWQAALAGGEREAGLYPQAALDLGRLNEVATPAGVIVTPCVAAIPEPAFRKREEPADDAGVIDVVALPLTVLANPRLVERRPVVAGGQPTEILILHVGGHRIWGVTAEVIVNLLARLGMARLGEE